MIVCEDVWREIGSYSQEDVIWGGGGKRGVGDEGLILRGRDGCRQRKSRNLEFSITTAPGGDIAYLEEIDLA